MEDASNLNALSKGAANDTNQSMGSIDASGVAKIDAARSFNANVGKSNSELGRASKPITTQMDSVQTTDVNKKSDEGLKGAMTPDGNQNMPDLPESKTDKLSFTDILAKKAQSYMMEKAVASKSEKPSGESPNPKQSQQSVNPKIGEGIMSPQRPDSSIAKPNAGVAEAPKISSPAFKSPPSIQVPKFTLPNFKR